MVWLLGGFARRAVLGVASLGGVSCTRGGGSTTTDSEAGTLGSLTSSETVAETTPSLTESTSSSVDSSGSTIATAEATETGNQDGCPPPDPTVFASSAGALTQDWPEGGTLDTPCDAVDLSVDKTTLRLSCVHPETSLAVEVVVSFPPGAVESQLDALPGTNGLLVSFYNPPRGSIGCSGCNDLRIHDADGRLIVLSNGTLLFDFVPAEGVAVDVTGAKWLEPRSEDYQNWSAPFGELQMRHVGCAPRASLRPGAETETPMAIEFIADDGLELVYDRNVEYGVEVDGQRFDVLVSDAFFRGMLNCGDCPFTVGSFLVLRSSI